MIDRALLAKYDVAVPRYTSYPTVPQWSATPSPEEWRETLTHSLADDGASLSVYVHLPFCESLCTFCGCNTVITRDHDRETPYVDLVLAELDLYLAATPDLARRPLVQLHLGGGTPTFFATSSLARLIDGIASRMPARSASFEASVEADPRVTSVEQLEALRAHGFSRLSLGVQDIDPEVQHLVNRRQTPESTERLLAEARQLGYESINVDLIYGLPAQTPESMRTLTDWTMALRPDRLAVYSFARVPWIKPAQRRFKDEQVPAGAEKRALYEIVREGLLGAGYLELGLDHFALADDGLTRASSAGSLHRNFMGYTEHRTTTLLGLGVSAISETPDCYHQNEKVIALYEKRVAKAEVPTLRGHKLTSDERRQRAQILSLMTTFAAEIDQAEHDDAVEYLAPLVADGLVEIDQRELRVLPEGRPFLRNAAAFFDRHYRTTQPAGPLYSKAL